MSFLVGNNFIFILVVGTLVFIFSYLNMDKFLNFMHKKTIGQLEEIYQLLDKLYVKADRKRVATALYLMSFGLGSLFFIALWPNIFVGFVLGVAVSIVGWSVPQSYLRGMWEKRCNRIVEQMVDGMTITANSVNAGLSITQAMERVTTNMTGPLAQEFELVLNQVRLGSNIEDALNEFGNRIPRQDVQMFVSAVNILRETGGNLGETFTTITTTIRERQKIEKKIDAMTIQGKTQAVIVTMVPFVIIIMFLLTNPTYVMPLFTKPLGWFCLVIMLGLQIMGGVLLKKIVTIKV